MNHEKQESSRESFGNVRMVSYRANDDSRHGLVEKDKMGRGYGGTGRKSRSPISYWRE